MKYTIHRADSRGHSHLGWLHSYHTFSFSGYYHPERIHFGALRVLNDDVVQGGKGFSTHPHYNMEIISIPLEGDLEHQDDIGNKTVIRKGDIQVMSAGTGVRHSEYNKNQDREVKFLQIWVIPDKQQVEPRYDQWKMEIRPDEWNQILSPDPLDQGVWIHQNAWFHLGAFTGAESREYHLKGKGNGLYVFLLEGSARIADQALGRRDGMGIWEETRIEIIPEAGSKILLMEVPMLQE